MSSAGVGSAGSVVSVPYSLSSTFFILVLSSFVESSIKIDVGLYPGTTTGVVLSSHENVIADGESLIVEY